MFKNFATLEFCLGNELVSWAIFGGGLTRYALKKVKNAPKCVEITT